MKARKTLALLVALCMMLSILPAVPAQTAQAAAGDVVLNFAVGTGSDAATINTAASTAGETWQIDTANSEIGTISMTTGRLWIRNDKPDGVVVITFNTAAAGTYTPNLELMHRTTYQDNCDLYIDGNYIGTVKNDPTGTDATYKTVTLGNVALAAGSHNFVVVNRGEVSGADGTYLSKLTLTAASSISAYETTVDFTSYATLTTVDNINAKAAYKGWQIDNTNSDCGTINTTRDRLWIKNDKPDGVVVITFNTAAAGTYTPNLELLHRTKYQDNCDLYIDGNYIGTVKNDPTGADATYKTVPLGNVALAAGSHNFVVVNRGEVTGADGTYIKELKLTPVQTGAAYENKIDFTSYASLTTIETINAKAAYKGWQIDKQATVGSGNISTNTTRLWVSANYGKLAVAFSSAVAGYYTPSLLINDDADSDSYDFYIDSKYVGSYINSTTENNENRTIELSDVYLTAGKHTVYFVRTGSVGNDGINLKAMSFAPTSEPVATDIKYVFNASNAGMETGETSIEELAKIDITAAGWTLNAANTSSATAAAPYINENYLTWNVGGTDKQIAIDVNVDIPGYYTAEALMNDFNADWTGDFAIYVKDGSSETYFGKITSTRDDDARDVMVKTFDTMYFDRGVHTLVFKVTGISAQGRGMITIKSLTLLAADAPKVIPSSDIFGSRYAYVTEENGAYNISFIGGLKSIAYIEAGFEVSINEIAVEDIVTDKAYKEIVADGNLCTADYYGGEYIFVATLENIEAGSTVTVKPYVLDEDGETKIYHGESFTLSLTI